MIWDRDTSANPDDWTPENPARGQCAVTALLVQELLGGELLRTKVRGESHYLNRLADGTIVDLTRQQFGNAEYDEAPSPRERSYVLSFPATVGRYALLRSRAQELLEDQS